MLLVPHCPRGKRKPTSSLKFRGIGDQMGLASHDDAPARLPAWFDPIDFERHMGLLNGRVELRSRVGAKHDVAAIDPVVHREDGGPGARESYTPNARRVALQELEAIVPVKTFHRPAMHADLLPIEVTADAGRFPGDGEGPFGPSIAGPTFLETTAQTG
jgi:hypothetical protein